jgi:6-pyruvoyltetrahydropterin/6-carboxytetrahydropterin synthase
MYEVTIETSFSSAHNIRGYNGACENLHGHNWKVLVTVRSAELDSLGMVIDFKKLKAETKKAVERLDHRYLNDVPPFDKINATAENIAGFLFAQLSRAVNTDSVKVSRMRVWESDTSMAEYHE